MGSSASGSLLVQPLYKDCTNTSVGFIPLNDMSAAQDYFNEEGGLYGEGMNVLPLSHPHSIQANQAALQVLPRNASGGIDVQDGKIGLISIGMSNTKNEFDTFIEVAQFEKSDQVVLVNGAQPGMTASDWAIPDPANDPWKTLADAILAAGLAPAQVQVVWLKQANGNPEPGVDDFPVYAQKLHDDLGEIVKSARQSYPNIWLVYFSSRIYAGYGQTNPLNPEPFAYESAFSVRWLIEDQINGGGSTGVDYTSAPVLLWGPYLWADGTTPRSDGLAWLCEDLLLDGTHPSPAGKQKVAGMLLDFLTTDRLARIWFTGMDQRVFSPIIFTQDVSGLPISR